MKGVILAGGHGTRLWPITHTRSKQLVPIANKPLIFYCIEHLKNAGITDIGIIVGHDPKRIAELEETIGDGSRWGVRISYIEQDKPRGVAHAIWLAKDFVGDSPCVVYLGDNMLRGGIADYTRDFLSTDSDFTILLSKHKEAWRFGVAKFDGDKLIGLVEKPEVPPSNWVISGIYFLRPVVFEVIEKYLQGPPGKRGEYQITDVADIMVRDENYIVDVLKIKEWWKDTGQPKEILEANRLVLEDLVPSNEGEVEEGASIVGKVSIGKGTVVKQGSNLRGPAIIGENCTIGPNVFIGPYSSIGDGCEISNSEVEFSMILGDCKIDAKNRIVDSIIGANSTITNRGDESPRGSKFTVGENSKIYL